MDTDGTLSGKRSVLSRPLLIVLILIVAVSISAAAILIAVHPEKTPGVVPSCEILEADYFRDLTGYDPDTAPDMSETLSEYGLVTVDTVAFMNDADTNGEVLFRVRGDRYRISLVPVPAPVSPTAAVFVKNESSVRREAPVPVHQYRGWVIGRETGDAFFTVSDDVLLGRISLGGTSYYIGQHGPESAAGGKIVHILYRSDAVIRRGSPRTFEPAVP